MNWKLYSEESEKTSLGGRQSVMTPKLLNPLE